MFSREPSAPRLITIPISHYCERARWALDYAGIPFREQAYAPLFHLVPVRRAGGRRTTPVLLTPTETLCDSGAIVRYADAHAPSNRRLYPTDPEPRARHDALELECAEKLGPATRRLAYFYLLQDRRRSLKTIGHRLGPAQRLALSVARPVVSWAIARQLQVTAEGAEHSRKAIQALFAKVGELLVDGRRYLSGEQFSAVDLTFAAMAAPVLAPPEYGVPLPRPHTLPREVASLIEEFRATPAGRFALRMFAEHRRRQD
jgi:glutathione S-transferase